MDAAGPRGHGDEVPLGRVGEARRSRASQVERAEQREAADLVLRASSGGFPAPIVVAGRDQVIGTRARRDGARVCASRARCQRDGVAIRAPRAS